jgi:hypothetical protein
MTLLVLTVFAAMGVIALAVVGLRKLDEALWDREFKRFLADEMRLAQKKAAADADKARRRELENVVRFPGGRAS